MRREHFLIYLSPALLASLALAYVLHIRSLERDGGGSRELGEDTYREVMSLIEEHYVTDVDRDELIFGAVKGMADVLDRHSRGYTPEEWRRFSDSSEGRSHGIGIRFGLIDGWLRVFHVFPRSPAARGGLVEGDRLVAIDGEEIARGTTPSMARNSIVGESGTRVRFTIEALESGRRREVEIVRGSYGIPSVTSGRRGTDGRLAYIRIANFTQSTADEFHRELERMEEQETDGILIDLRDNPGGSLPAAVAVVGSFVKTDRVLTSVYRKGSRTYPALQHVVVPDRPVAILVNDGSASASEIVAGALQDFRRALIVGEHSYGKGLVQKVFTLRSRETGVKITTARWLTPAGRTIQRRHDDDVRGGILPDLVVAMKKSDRRWVRETWSRLELKPFVIEMLDRDPDQVHLPDAFRDLQLDAAVAALEGESPTRRVEP